MMYAINAVGERIAPERQLDALCPGCRQPVMARCGDINVHHWAHVSGCECDPWHEPETRWHIKWKMQFEEKEKDESQKVNDSVVTSDWQQFVYEKRELAILFDCR